MARVLPDAATLDDVPGGRGVLVRIISVGVDGTDKEIDAAEYGQAPAGDDFLVGLLAAAFMTWHYRIKDWFAALKLPRLAKPVLGGFLVAVDLLQQLRRLAQAYYAHYVRFLVEFVRLPFMSARRRWTSKGGFSAAAMSAGAAKSQ